MNPPCAIIRAHPAVRNRCESSRPFIGETDVAVCRFRRSAVSAVQSFPIVVNTQKSAITRRDRDEGLRSADDTLVGIPEKQILPTDDCTDTSTDFADLFRPAPKPVAQRAFFCWEIRSGCFEKHSERPSSKSFPAHGKAPLDPHEEQVRKVRRRVRAVVRRPLAVPPFWFCRGPPREHVGRVSVPQARSGPERLDQLNLACVIDGMACDSEHEAEELRIGQGRLHSAVLDVAGRINQPLLKMLEQAGDARPTE